MPDEILVTVMASFEVPGTHYWPDANGEVAYLRHPHRHLFKIEVYKQVGSLDREVEFITLAQQARQLLYNTFDVVNGTVQFEQRSCEQIALFLLEKLDLDQCSVFEDGENGAIVQRAKRT